MVIKTLLFKSTCSISGNSIVTEKETIQIESLDEIEGYKLLMRIGLALFIIGLTSFILVPFILKDIIATTEPTDQYVKLGAMSLGVILYGAAFIEVCRAQKYHYAFKVNVYYRLLLEESDRDKYYDDIKNIEALFKK